MSYTDFFQHATASLRLAANCKKHFCNDRVAYLEALLRAADARASKDIAQ